jgi:hypothetical protein
MYEGMQAHADAVEELRAAHEARSMNSMKAQYVVHAAAQLCTQ